jgi:hypothetical protein
MPTWAVTKKEAKNFHLLPPVRRSMRRLSCCPKRIFLVLAVAGCDSFLSKKAAARKAQIGRERTVRFRWTGDEKRTFIITF